MKRILVTGGCGFIGSYLSRELIKHGCELMLFDSFLNYMDPFTSNYQYFMIARMADLMDKVKIERGDLPRLIAQAHAGGATVAPSAPTKSSTR